MHRLMHLNRLIALCTAWTLVGLYTSHAEAQYIDAGRPYGKLKVIDLIDFSKPSTYQGRSFRESAPNTSQIQTVLGKKVRVLVNQGEKDKYFAYVMGKDKGLQAGKSYVLWIEYPEDKPRSMVFINRGAEYARGIYTGNTVGDQMFAYTSNNLESIRLPLTGTMRHWKTLFFLHERSVDLRVKRDNSVRTRTPQDGFWVAVAQYRKTDAPLSHGAAVSKIALLEVSNLSSLYLKTTPLPPGLPKRYTFWREEMSDDVVNTKDPKHLGTTDAKWYEYKAQLMRFLGFNTFSKDLLEFGYNQGWNSGNIYEGRKWYEISRFPKRWERILALAKKYGLYVMPYYEYTGARGMSEHKNGKTIKHGLGYQKRCRPLYDKHKDYSPTWWSENACADITDPDAFKDVTKLLEATIFRHKNKATFIGAWFRQRPGDLPVSFTDSTLTRFSKEVHSTAQITRKQLQSDSGLLQKYYTWWYEKRRSFLTRIRDVLHSKLGSHPAVLFTAQPTEPGPPMKYRILTDDIATWKPFQKLNIWAKSIQSYNQEGGYLKDATRAAKRWSDWELDHSAPPADPQRYKQTKKVYMTYPFNRNFTVSSDKTLEAFRSQDGLAMIRFYPLNEDDAKKPENLSSLIGYFVADMERTGALSMLSEVRAMANGDPRYIGYLSSSSYNRGFPYYVRRFYAAFLALPALPSMRLSKASNDPEIVVRSISTPNHGTYIAVINTGLKAKKNVSIQLSLQGDLEIIDLVANKKITHQNGRILLQLDQVEMRSFHITKRKRPPREPSKEPISQEPTQEPEPKPSETGSNSEHTDSDVEPSQPSKESNSTDTVEPIVNKDGGLTRDVSIQKDTTEVAGGCGCHVQSNPSFLTLIFLCMLILFRRKK